MDTEKGNYDYLIGCDLNMNHPEVSGELKHWGKWMLGGPRHYNMANLLAGTLMQTLPNFAVSVMENHDTQPPQALESVVEAWFNPLAMEVGKRDTAFIDCTAHLGSTIISNQDGWAEFHCPSGSVSVWVEAAAWGPFLALSTRVCLVASVSTSLPLWRR